MALSLGQLIKVVQSDNVRDGLLQEFQSLGLNTARWHEGTPQRTFIEKASALYAEASESVDNIAKGGLLGLAAGLWLDLIGESFYRVERARATAAVHTIKLTHASGPNHTWDEGTLIVGTIGTADVPAVQFESISSGAISAGESVTLSVRCKKTGVIGSVSPEQIVEMVTTLSGVTVTNPANPLTGTSMVVVGVDDETDERYTRRCELRWQELTYGVGPLAYERWVLEADASINRVSVLNPTGDGTIRIIAATAAGGISAEQIAAVTAYIADGRRPLNDTPSVESAVPYTVAIAAAPTARRGEYATTAAAETAITNAWDDYFASLPIGGVIVAPSVSGQVIRDELIERAMAVPGMRRLGMTSPTGDANLGSTAVAVGSYALTTTLESP